MIFSIKYIKNGGIYMDKTVLSILLFVLGLGIGLALVFLFLCNKVYFTFIINSPPFSLIIIANYYFHVNIYINYFYKYH